jgi:hypothetical protein
VRFDSGLSDHCASPSYPRASNAADGRPFFARGPDGSCVRHGTQRSPSSDLPTGHLVRTATAFGRSHSHPPRPGHRHSVRVLLSSPEAPPALRTSSSSHCRKEQQRQRKEEEPRKILPPPPHPLSPYDLSLPHSQLVWRQPHLFPSAGPAGRDPRSLLQQAAVVICTTPGTCDTDTVGTRPSANRAVGL